MAINPISIASSTAPNWLKEAQESLVAAANPGGMMGGLQAAAKGGNGSIKSYLASSQNSAASLAMISSSTAQASFDLINQMAAEAASKRTAERFAMQAKLNQQPANYTPGEPLAPTIYFDDGSTLDTVNNILTMVDGKQIDTVTGQEYIAPGSLIQMANGAYLDTKKNILTLPDGTKINTVTGLVITV